MRQSRRFSGLAVLCTAPNRKVASGLTQQVELFAGAAVPQGYASRIPKVSTFKRGEVNSTGH